MKIIHRNDLLDLARSAAGSPRRRSHRNLHDSLDAQVQRLFIGMQPDTYVRPHRHPQEHKWELFLLVEGAVSVLLFTHDGELHDRIELDVAGNRLVEIPPHTWHCLICQAPDTVLFEVKEGAYVALDDKDFAAWAPLEGDPKAAEILEKLRHAQPGERFAHR